MKTIDMKYMQYEPYEYSNSRVVVSIEGRILLAYCSGTSEKLNLVLILE